MVVRVEGLSLFFEGGAAAFAVVERHLAPDLHQPDRIAAAAVAVHRLLPLRRPCLLFYLVVHRTASTLMPNIRCRAHGATVQIETVLVRTAPVLRDALFLVCADQLCLGEDMPSHRGFDLRFGGYIQVG